MEAPASESATQDVAVRVEWSRLRWCPASAARGPASASRGPLPAAWSIGNFKPVELARAELKHLSILAGANSSGKSSLIQSLLFLAQSVVEGEAVLNGPLVGLGGPRDAIRDGESVLSLGCSLVTPTYASRTSLAPDDPDARTDAALELTFTVSGEGLSPASISVDVAGELALQASRVRLSSLPDGLAVRQRQVLPDATVMRVTDVAGWRPNPERAVAAA